MSDIVIKVENLSKQYRLGVISHGTLHRDLQSWWARMRGKEDPNSLVSVSQPFTIHDSQFTSSSDDRFWALQDVSFDVKQGEILGIIGRNGAGKSTLLKILSRVTAPTKGVVKIKGRVASLLEVGTGFHPELTGRENIFLNGAILGMTKTEINRKFDEIVAFAEIEKFIDTPVKRYSSGMYVRLAFAVAAHLEPEILIVDEVLAVGDISFQKKCLGKMGDVARGGRTVLFVSHNMSAIRTLCESAVWLDNGQIVKRGTADEVVRNYEESQIMHRDDFATVVERNPEDVKNSSFYIKRVEILNEESEHTNMFKYNDKLILIVDFSGEPKLLNYSISFNIYNEIGQLVSAGSSGGYHNVYFDKNTKAVIIEIGPLIFTSGKYSISLKSWYGEGSTAGLVDTWDYALYFTLDSQPFRPGRNLSLINDGVCVIQHSFSVIK